MIALPSPEQRDRVSLLILAGAPGLAALGFIAGLRWTLWLLLLLAGLGAWLFRRVGWHHPTLAEDIRAAFPARRAPRVSVRPLPGGALAVLSPSPALTDPQLRTVLAGPVAGHGYQIAGIRQQGNGSVRVSVVELSLC